MYCAQKFAVTFGLQRYGSLQQSGNCSETAVDGPFGSCATDHCEPCQVLTEAALSGTVGVPQGSLNGVREQLSQSLCAVMDRTIGAKSMVFCFH